MWRVWRCEGKKVLEAPTGRLPNGRVDIYPGRLWAVAAAPTEMIQPAIWNIGFYSDGWNSYCAGSGDVWGLCAYILSLNLPTHSIWHRCCWAIERRCWQSSCIVHDGMGIAWWRNKAQHVSGNTKTMFSITFCWIIHARCMFQEGGGMSISTPNASRVCLFLPLKKNQKTESCFCSVMFLRVTMICLCVLLLFKIRFWQAV